MMDGQSLWLTLAPAADENRIAGRLRDERGAEHGFSSWLGLLSLLEAMRARTQDAPSEPGATVPELSGGGA
jgi:hypothetical protein